MVRARRAVCLLLLPTVFLGGCWNYRGLDEMAITVGMAIDKKQGADDYLITFEMADLSANVKERGVTAMLLDSEGKTLFDATRNAKKRIISKLYFGHMQTIVLSGQLAREEDIGKLIDWFLRSAEFRQTLCVVISQEKTAREILANRGIGNKVVAFEIQRIALEDSEHTSSTSYAELYDVYNTLKTEGISLTLPAVCTAVNDDTAISQINGTAVFKGQRLAGYLTPEESMYFLFVMDKLKSAILTVSSDGEDPDNVSLEIKQNRTDTAFRIKDGAVQIDIKTKTDVHLNEIDASFDALDENRIAALEAAAEDKIEQNISAVVQKVQDAYGADIFGFGNMIYRQDPALWKTLSADWDALFGSLAVNVASKVDIVNSASVKKS